MMNSCFFEFVILEGQTDGYLSWFLEEIITMSKAVDIDLKSDGHIDFAWWYAQRVG